MQTALGCTSHLEGTIYLTDRIREHQVGTQDNTRLSTATLLKQFPDSRLDWHDVSAEDPLKGESLPFCFHYRVRAFLAWLGKQAGTRMLVVTSSQLIATASELLDS